MEPSKTPLDSNTLQDEEKEEEAIKNNKTSSEKEANVSAENAGKPKVSAEGKNQQKVPEEQKKEPKVAAEEKNEPQVPAEEKNQQNVPEEQGKEPKVPAEQKNAPQIPAKQEKEPKVLVEKEIKTDMEAEKESKQRESGDHEDKSHKSTGEKQIKFQLNDDASDDSISSEVIRNEFKDMYGEGEEYEEMDEMEEEGEEEGEEDGEEEEASEEEDLSEFKLELESKYMKGVEFSEEYLIKENKKIEDVPLQLYAIETYINSVRTFYGYGNHWLRLKIFDIPCFEIRPYNKVLTQASLYPNRSIDRSKGSLYPEGNPNYPKLELDENEILSQRREELENKRLDFDLRKISAKEKRITIDRLMREELTRAGTEFFSELSLKTQSKEKDVGLDIPILDLLEEEEIQRIPLERKGSKIWILREPLENGKTVMFPMMPSQMVHQLQRQPLKFFVLSTSGLMSSGQLELSGLTEAVIRAAKGPPYPITSVQRFKTITTGDFTAKVVGTIRVVAIGPRNVAKIKCEDNVNDREDRRVPRRNQPNVTVYNMDSQGDKAPMLTGPQNFTLCDIVENIRARRQKEKYKPEPQPAPKRYYVEDLVFNRAKNTVVRAPKKTYLSLRAEIDRYLVLNKTRKKRPKVTAFEEESAEGSVGERSTIDEEAESEEELELEVEEEEAHEDEERAEAVFQGLVEVYGQKGETNKAQTPPPPTATEVEDLEESLPTKQSDTKKRFSPSSIWKRFGSTNSKRKKQKSSDGMA